MNKKNPVNTNHPSNPFPTMPLWFWISGVVLSIIKIKLVSGMTLSVNAYTRYDDRLFLNLAHAIMNGSWLGPYNHLTLSKGPFYPVWIAFNASLGIPLLLAQHLFYIGACILVVLAVRPLLSKPVILLILFSVLLFNPISFTDEVMTRVVREGIYPGLTLMVFAFAIGFLVRIQESAKYLFPWAIGLGISLSAFWLTREEGIWIITSLFFTWGMMLYKIWKFRGPGRPIKLSLWALPLGLWMSFILFIALVNSHTYGVFLVNEFKSTPFLNAYGALSRVHPEKIEPMVPVSREVREKVYTISPAFNNLKRFLEDGIGKGWTTISCSWISVCHDIGGGWFMWAFRDAVAAAGFHVTGETAARYYDRLAGEINAACKIQKIECGKKRSTLLPVWRHDYLWPMVKTFLKGTAYTLKMEGFKPTSSPSIGSEKSLKQFRQITHETLSPPSTKEISFSDRDDQNPTLTVLGTVYQFSFPVFSILSFILFLILTYRMVRLRKINTIWIISTALLTASMIRLLMLSYIEVTSFPGINTLYISPIYPLVLLFDGLILFLSWSELKNRPV